jgi:hypothetical protein
MQGHTHAELLRGHQPEAGPFRRLVRGHRFHERRVRLALRATAVVVVVVVILTAAQASHFTGHV